MLAALYIAWHGAHTHAKAVSKLSSLMPTAKQCEAGGFGSNRLIRVPFRRCGRLLAITVERGQQLHPLSAISFVVKFPAWHCIQRLPCTGESRGGIGIQMREDRLGKRQSARVSGTRENFFWQSLILNLNPYNTL